MTTPSKADAVKLAREMLDQQTLGRASQIITIAMGTTVYGRGRGTKYVRNADADPLAYWMGVEAIMQLVEDAVGRAILGDTP